MEDDACRRRPISVAQWQAARALSEGAPATRARVAAVLGCDISSVYTRAATEGWKQINFRGRHAQEAHAEFIAAVSGEAEDASGTFSGLDEEAVAESVTTTGESADGGNAEPPADGWADGDAVVAVARQARTGASEDADATPDDDGEPAQMLARGARFMSRRLGRMIRRAERGAGLNKSEIDGLTALGRMMERWETLATERAKQQEETQSDAELAETFRGIDRRILCLARQEAERMVAAGYRPGDGDESF